MQSSMSTNTGMQQSTTSANMQQSPVSEERDTTRLFPGETGWCAWCRKAFTCMRLYSKPQHFCNPQCNHRWHNHANYVRQALYNKSQGIPLSGGMQKSLQVEAERRMTNCDVQNHKAKDLIKTPHPQNF